MQASYSVRHGMRAATLRRCAARVAFTCASLAAVNAFAAADAEETSGTPAMKTDAQAPSADPPANFWTRDTLLGDMGGLRPWLGKYGVTLNLNETSEYLANLRGGLKRGGAYDGLTTMALDVDTDKAFGLPGGRFNASALQIHAAN